MCKSNGILETLNCGFLIYFFHKKCFKTYIFTNNTLFNPFIFQASFQGNGVHATSTAVVSGAQPIFFNTLQSRIAPREEITEMENLKLLIIFK